MWTNNRQLFCILANSVLAWNSIHCSLFAVLNFDAACKLKVCTAWNLIAIPIAHFWCSVQSPKMLKLFELKMQKRCCRVELVHDHHTGTKSKNKSLEALSKYGRIVFIDWNLHASLFCQMQVFSAFKVSVWLLLLQLSNCWLCAQRLQKQLPCEGVWKLQNFCKLVPLSEFLLQANAVHCASWLKVSHFHGVRAQ